MAILYSQARSCASPVERLARPPGAQERLLQRVLGLLEGAEHPVAVHVQLAPVALDGLLEVASSVVMSFVIALMPFRRRRGARTHRSAVARAPAGVVRTHLTHGRPDRRARRSPDHLILGGRRAAARWAWSIKARHLKLDRDVALKVIAPELSEDREFRIRFQREYEAEVSIRHPNVVRVYGAGAKDGRLFVTMQYVDGLRPGGAAARRAQLAPALAARAGGAGRRRARRRPRARDRPPRRQARQRPDRGRGRRAALRPHRLRADEERQRRRPRR